MSGHRNDSSTKHLPSLRHRTSNINVEAAFDEPDMTPPASTKLKGVSSSLDSIRISPRTPTAMRTVRGSTDGFMGETEEVELSLLDEQERARAGQHLNNGEALGHFDASKKKTLSNRDKKAMVLLIILYLIQGVPLGLALGSVPFLLKDHLSYSQLGLFALTNYPYSLKLLWSPIVDSTFIPSIGRRKSWIIPMQIIIGTLMFYISLNVEKLLDHPADNLYEITFVFTSLVFFSATQDIAVDGWALTLLSEENLSYASTCQTIGLNTGYFASFTVFLALNSEAFAEKWGIPQLTLGPYLRFCSLLCFGVTLWLIFFEKEGKESLDDSDMTVNEAYKTIWNICKLKNVQGLVMMLFFAKIGWAAADAVTQLKMIEKGLGREDLAIVVLIDFPFQILGGWLAAKWSIGDRPLRPWIWAFWPRMGFALLATLTVYWFPSRISYGFFVYLVVQTVLQSFAATIQFVGISAFHTRISDPLIGGTYMTLLNTFANLGGTWPKYFVLKGVDYFSIATCQVGNPNSELVVKASECVSEHGKSICADIGGACVTERDGYYIVSAICMMFGVVFLVGYIIPMARKLQALPMQRWRISPE
ncbi:acetyl-coenzyme A transporter 1-domain-containing protein [Hygrophoropsis aurantiaca]|uniref:Acetyl-coenzyme A transporter 1-domain-containing protein n=1 Tax=Hygrophoropsis aurantiaca TaxID=72124 RepID=A0ACB8AMI0_9AGAM|nr:acetyl-coenzyme A transporter 1-domain-containing protein [Hygrophoropsis aurantiaca]